MIVRLKSKGFTLIEAMVVVSTIGLLAMISLPAVQAAREAARRAACASNLRQIGIALHSYHATCNCFPLKVSASGTSSAFASILNYLDQSNLYNSINFSWSGTVMVGFPGQVQNAAAATAANTGLGVFLCPSDSMTPDRVVGNSYRFNIGVGPAEVWSLETMDSANGFLTSPGCTSDAQFIDGLSHTAAVSERLMGSGGVAGLGLPERDYHYLQNQYGVFCYGDADYALDGCYLAAHMPTSLYLYTAAGTSWFLAGLQFTHYNHAQEPNGIIPDALCTTYVDPWGVSGARSWHNGGVNVLMADGSARFEAETIQRSVWRGLGTRNGGEPID
jgi:prepilin-type processing-associated H-X9-DG protein